MALDRRISPTVTSTPAHSQGADIASRLSSLLGQAVQGLAQSAAMQRQQLEQQRREQEQAERQGFNEELVTLASEFSGDDGAFDTEGFMARVDEHAAGKASEFNQAAYRADGFAVASRYQARTQEWQRQSEAWLATDIASRLGVEGGAISTALDEQFSKLGPTSDAAEVDPVQVASQIYERTLGTNTIGTDIGRRNLYTGIQRHVIAGYNARVQARRAHAAEWAVNAAANSWSQIVQDFGPSLTVDLGMQGLRSIRGVMQDAGVEAGEIAEVMQAGIGIMLDRAEVAGSDEMIETARALNGRLPRDEQLDPSRFTAAAVSAGNRRRTAVREAVAHMLSGANHVRDFADAHKLLRSRASSWNHADESHAAEYAALGAMIDRERSRWAEGLRAGLRSRIDDTITAQGGALFADQAREFSHEIDMAVGQGWMTEDQADLYRPRIAEATRARTQHDAEGERLRTQYEIVSNGGHATQPLGDIDEATILAFWEEQTAPYFTVGDDGTGIVGDQARFAESFATMQTMLGDRMPGTLVSQVQLSPGASVAQVQLFLDVATALRRTPQGAAFLEQHIASAGAGSEKSDSFMTQAAMFLHSAGIRDAGRVHELLFAGENKYALVSNALADIAGSKEEPSVLDEDLRGFARAAAAGVYLAKDIDSLSGGLPAQLASDAARTAAHSTVQASATEIRTWAGKDYIPRAVADPQRNRVIEIADWATPEQIRRVVEAQIRREHETLDEQTRANRGMDEFFDWSYYQPRFSEAMEIRDGRPMVRVDYAAETPWWRRMIPFMDEPAFSEVGAMWVEVPTRETFARLIEEIEGQEAIEAQRDAEENARLGRLLGGGMLRLGGGP